MPFIRAAILWAMVLSPLGVYVHAALHADTKSTVIVIDNTVAAAETTKVDMPAEEHPTDTTPAAPSNETITVEPSDEEIPKPPKGTMAALVVSTFPEDPDVALAIAKGESGLNPSAHSMSDLTIDGRAYSIGLMQINLAVTGVNDLVCPKAFIGTPAQKNVQIVDEKLYKACVKAAENPHTNLAIARRKYEGRNHTFGAWGAFTDGSWRRHYVKS
jgi:hypothetical protein